MTYYLLSPASIRGMKVLYFARTFAQAKYQTKDDEKTMNEHVHDHTSLTTSTKITKSKNSLTVGENNSFYNVFWPISQNFSNTSFVMERYPQRL